MILTLLQLCVTDGNWAAWSDWTSCTATCAGGDKIRTRTCTDPAPENGGAECEGSSSQSITCNTHECPSMYSFHY